MNFVETAIVPEMTTKAPPQRRPVRVCFMIDRLATAGTETQLIALIRRLDRGRVQPALCLLDGEDAQSRALEPADVPILRLGVRSLHHPATLGKALRLGRFLRRERIDVLQVYYPDSSYLGVPVGRLAGVPAIVRTRNNLGYWMTPTHRVLGRLLRPLVTATIANCEACRQTVRADGGSAPEPVVVLENGVDLDRFPGGPWTASAAGRVGPRRVGVVANLRPVKGLDVFVRAAARVAAAHPDVIFQIAGEGPSRPDLEQRIAEAGLAERFSLPGSVADVPAFLRQLDVAVLCSRSEGMSNAVLEYMAAGRPIVATAVGANPTLLEQGTHGLLVPPDDPDALAVAINRLLNDPAAAERLAASAHRQARERYSRAAMVRRFEDFYERLTDSPRLDSERDCPH